MTDTPIIVGTLVKLPDAIKDFTVDWSGDLATGVTISSATVSIEESTPSIAIDSFSNDADSVNFIVSGGEVGEKWTVTVGIVDSAGNELYASVQVRVEYLVLGTNTYAERDAADDYHALAENTAWLGYTAKARDGYLIRATRLLERQRWRGTRTAAGQALAWPRTGLTLDGVAVATDSVPQKIRDACCELALAIAAGSDVEDVANQSQKTQSIRAGSVAVSYFRGAEGPRVRFPQKVHELLRDLLVAGQLSVSGVATGVEGSSGTDRNLGFSRGI